MMANITVPFVGTWTLISFVLYSTLDPNGPPVLYPMGHNPLGRLTFTRDNYIHCLLTTTEAMKPIRSPIWSTASDQEIVHAARSASSYCGTFHLLEQDGKKQFSTKVDVALDPNYYGTNQVRNWELKKENGKELLVLTPAFPFYLLGGMGTTGVLTWERLGSSNTSTKA